MHSTAACSNRSACSPLRSRRPHEPAGADLFDHRGHRRHRRRVGARPGRDFAAERNTADVNVFQVAAKHIEALTKAKKRVVIAAWSEGSAERLAGVLTDHGVEAVVRSESWRHTAALPKGAHALVVLPIEHGFETDQFALLAEQDLVVEGADNFATKFLTADAARLRGIPVAHAGAVRWSGWAFLSAATPAAGPCLRCVFEDIPGGRAETCATAGVLGPVVGVVAALQSSLVLSHLAGDPFAVGTLFHYDALAGKLRRFQARPRPGCPLCAGEISDLRMERYVPSPN